MCVLIHAGSAVAEISSVQFLETPLTSPYYDVSVDTPLDKGIPCGVCNCELPTASRKYYMYILHV